MAKMKGKAIHQGTMPRTVLALLVLFAAAALSACGGGGGAASSASSSSGKQSTSTPPPAPAPVTTPDTEEATVSNADLALALRLYKGDERTPEGFDLEDRPANVLGTISTRHLRNSDFSAGQQSIGSVYEMCTNDMAQALDWSERLATWHGEYSDMVEIRSDNRLFEIMRVPRADVTALVRHRVFRCDYLDRSGSDLRSDAGSAGSMNQRPLTADELASLAEYLWQFTMFNNSDYAVVSSSGESAAGSIAHTIRLGQLVPGANGGCDTVEISDWTHTMSTTDGRLTRALTPVRSFSVSGDDAGAESCGG